MLNGLYKFTYLLIYLLTYYDGPAYRPTEMYAARVACCPLVSYC